jgi:hypothetical protein
MPPGLQPIDPPSDLRGAARAFAVIGDGQSIGQVVLVLAQRPHGATLRRLWWARPPANDPRPIPRPFDARRQPARQPACALARTSPGCRLATSRNRGRSGHKFGGGCALSANGKRLTIRSDRVAWRRPYRCWCSSSGV